MSTNHNIKYQSFFDTKHIKSTLKQKTIIGGMWTLFSQIGGYAIHLVSTVVLARLLTPDDYGLIAMVAVVTQFGMQFNDMGLSMATVQREKITHEQVSTLFWINLVISSSIGFLLVAMSPLISWFYNEPKVTMIVVSMAMSFPLSGMALQHNALLKRQMRFKTTSKIQLLASLISTVAGILAAWKGLGYWSLVIMQLVNSVWVVVATWTVCPWKPGLPRRGVGVRSMLAFGGNITGFNLVNYFSRNADNLLIGKYCGKEELGLYARAYQLLMLPINQIRNPILNVATPAMSMLQNDEKKYSALYYKILFVLALISMPITTFLAVEAKDIVQLVLGEKWLGMTPLFCILAITSVIQTVASTRGLVLISSGQGGKYFKWGLTNAIVTVISFVIGLKWQAKGVAISYCIANYIILFPSLWYCFKGSHVTPLGFWLAITGPLVASVIMGGAIFSLNSWIDNITLLPARIITNLALGIVFFTITLLAVPHWSKQLKESVGIFASIRKKQAI